MQRRLIASYLLLVTVTLALFTIPSMINLATHVRDNQAQVALREARSIAFLLGHVIITPADPDPQRTETATLVLSELRAALERETGARVELVDADGVPALGRPVHPSITPSLQAARRGEDTIITTTDATTTDSALGEPALEVTVPARDDFERVNGAVRISYPTGPIDEQIREQWYFRLAVGLGTLIAAVVASVFLARSLTRPLRELDAMARRLSDGDFSARVVESDPAETRQLARTLNQGARRLGVLVSSQQRFVADASHQLRTPLTALRLNLDNLYDVQDTDQGRRSAERAIGEVERMASLVNDLLLLARAQAGNARPQVLRLRNAVARRAEVWRAAAGHHQIGLSVDVPANAWVGFDGSQLDQVLDNVLSNALRVAPPQSTIGLTARCADHHVVLDITDQGPGMTDEQKEKAFERFWCATPGGTGLGLAIVKQFVEDNDGEVTLLDRPGGGLVVQVRMRATAAGSERATDDRVIAAHH